MGLELEASASIFGALGSTCGQVQGQAQLEEDRACSSKGDKTLISFPRRPLPARSPNPNLIFLAMGSPLLTGHSLFSMGPSQDAPCLSLPAWSPRSLPAATSPSQGTALCASCLTGPLHGANPCTPLTTAIAKPLADDTLLDEVLKFQKGTLPLSRSSWEEGPSFSSTPSRVPFSSSLGKGR